MKKLNPADFLTEAEKDQLSKEGFEITEQCQQAYNRELFMVEMAKLAERYLIDGAMVKIDVKLPGQISNINIDFNLDDLDENK